MKQIDKCLDSQLWHASAGGMVQMPAVNSKVYYFPQGHAEHAQGSMDFGTSQRIPPFILSTVTSVKFLAEPETDEVFAKIRMVPLTANELDCGQDDAMGLVIDGSNTQEKLASFAKTLTQSDANNGGGFSVPRYCAETIFPRLDYSVDPPVQTVLGEYAGVLREGSISKSCNEDPMIPCSGLIRLGDFFRYPFHAACIQGARHAHFGVSLSDIHLNKLQLGLFHAGVHHLDQTTPPSRITTGLIIDNPAIRNNISCLLTIGNASHSTEKLCNDKPPQLVLFGKTILTEDQISLSNSGDMVFHGATGNSSADGNLEKTTNMSDVSGAMNHNIVVDSSSCELFKWDRHRNHNISEFGLETGHCKIFMESVDVGRTLDLSMFESYEELYTKLADMFGIGKSEIISHVIYNDAAGAVKHTGDEPYRLGSGSFLA
ncbi:hypothetical protein GW17_00047508 [Ensete ventricosum]|nr:hypothetical protein GW17_00047508 [Ensete ventricosum]